MNSEKYIQKSVQNIGAVKIEEWKKKSEEYKKSVQKIWTDFYGGHGGGWTHVHISPKHLST